MHNEVDRHLLRFQVAHVDNPDAVDTTLIGKVQLFAQLRDGRGVYPSVVPRTTIHVNVIVKAQSTLALAFEVTSLTADIAPVVITEQQRHVIWYGKACVVVSLHLCKDGPELWHSIRTTIDVLDDLSLTFNHLAERLHILRIVALTHGHIAVATHADGYQVVVILIALHTLAEELIHTFLVSGVIPWTHLFLSSQVFLVRTHHRLMVRGSHHDAHLVSQSGTFRIVLIKGCSPHGRPEIVGLQTQQQFEDMSIGLRVDATKLVGAPTTERWPLVVDEDATIFHLGRGLYDTSAIIIQFVLMLHRHICHPIPRRHADVL